MFSCSHSSARLNKTSYEIGHYKIGPPFLWSFKKPFLLSSPHWICLFWTRSVRCGHSFSERLEGQQCLLVITAAFQVLLSALPVIPRVQDPQSWSLQAISAPPSGVLEVPWFSRLDHSPQQGKDPADPLAAVNLPPGRLWFPLFLIPSSAETLCIRWVGFSPVCEMAPLIFSLVLDPPPVSKPKCL